MNPLNAWLTWVYAPIVFLIPEPDYWGYAFEHTLFACNSSLPRIGGC